MLTHTVCETDEHADGFQLELRGRRVRAIKLWWTGQGWVPTEDVVGEGEWNFDAQAVQVVDARMPRHLVPVMNRVFGQHLRELDRPRQRGIFPEACSVCGVDRDTFPETAVRDGHGNIVERNGRKWMSDDQPLRWDCHVCGRLVCRRCTLTWPGATAQYYFHTYCSESCRAAAPPDFADDDEYHR